jgi:hypothetical protein
MSYNVCMSGETNFKQLIKELWEASNYWAEKGAERVESHRKALEEAKRYDAEIPELLQKTRERMKLKHKPTVGELTIYAGLTAAGLLAVCRILNP